MRKAEAAVLAQKEMEVGLLVTDFFDGPVEVVLQRMAGSGGRRPAAVEARAGRQVRRVRRARRAAGGCRRRRGRCRRWRGRRRRRRRLLGRSGRRRPWRRRWRGWRGRGGT